MGVDGTLHWWAALIGLALATMLICEIGVFTPVAVLIVAPLAIEMGSKLHISKLALLTALSGGGKAGNIISPNPNAIAAASGFHVDLAEPVERAGGPSDRRRAAHARPNRLGDAYRVA